MNPKIQIKSVSSSGSLLILRENIQLIDSMLCCFEEWMVLLWNVCKLSNGFTSYTKIDVCLQCKHNYSEANTLWVDGKCLFEQSVHKDIRERRLRAQNEFGNRRSICFEPKAVESIFETQILNKLLTKYQKFLLKSSSTHEYRQLLEISKHLVFGFAKS